MCLTYSLTPLKWFGKDCLIKMQNLFFKSCIVFSIVALLLVVVAVYGYVLKQKNL